jgi:hypothetical protein
MCFPQYLLIDLDDIPRTIFPRGVSAPALWTWFPNTIIAMRQSCVRLCGFYLLSDRVTGEQHALAIK